MTKGREFETIVRIAGEIAPGVQKAIEAVSERLDKMEAATKEVERAAKESKAGFTVMKGALADLVSEGIQSVISMAADAASSIYGLAESTREYREDIGKLETAFESAGHAVEQGTAVYKELYSVFGEEDRAVEAAQQIAALADNQDEMARMVDIATGAWARWGDSLATESLMEAMNSTAKIGTVQGTLADALERSGVNLDSFNDRLAEMSTEEERSAYILDTLNGLYDDAAAKYRANNESIIAARMANSDYTDSLAAMGEKIEPVTTAVQEGMNKILTKILEIMDKTDFTEIAEQVGELIDLTIDLAENGVGWLKENAEWLIPVIGGLTAGFAAYKAISIGVAATEAIKTAVLATGTTVVSAAAVATWAFNSAVAFLTSPITIAVAAIAALTAGVIWLYNNWDTAKVKVMEFGEKVGKIWKKISDWIGNAIETIGEYFPIFGGYLDGWWSSISDAVENVKAIFRGIIDFISNVFSGNWSSAWQNIVDIFGNLFGGIVNVAKAPINGVIGAINHVIDSINDIGFTIPDWVPVIGGEKFSIDIPKIPMFATGGITNGLSIAGEDPNYPNEYIISLNPAYREQNLAYWAEAGRMLNADYSDFTLGGTSGGVSIDFGGITFAPNITVTGHADKNSIMEAIEAEYPEFIDMLEEYFAERGALAYV